MDGFELAVRAILSQQVSVPAARRLAQQLVAKHGELASRAYVNDQKLTHVFPTAERLASAKSVGVGMQIARRSPLEALVKAATAAPNLFRPMERLRKRSRDRANSAMWANGRPSILRCALSGNRMHFPPRILACFVAQRRLTGQSPPRPVFLPVPSHGGRGAPMPRSTSGHQTPLHILYLGGLMDNGLQLLIDRLILPSAKCYSWWTMAETCARFQNLSSEMKRRQT